MKFIWLLILITFSTNSLAQKTTYSKYEESIIRYANNGLAYATKYDSLEIAKETLDSCWKFIEKYPNSFVKPNVLSYMLEITIILTDEMTQINPLIDSVFYYDKLASTRLRIGEMLIERNLDLQRGRDFIIDAFPALTVKHHKYRAYMLMARLDISLGNYTLAKSNYEKALQLEPDRISAWYEYLSYSKMNELPQTASYIESKIKELEDKGIRDFVDQATSGPNINKTVYQIALDDLDGKPVKLSEYEEKVLVINQFNFWCGWCIKEFPTLKKMIKEFPKVVFLFFNAFDSSNELREYYFTKPEFSFLKKQKVLFVNKQYYDQIYGYSVPHTLVVDKSGRVRFEYFGYNDKLEKLLRTNLIRLSKE